MLSRVAENLYWLGRYLERAENVARMARVDFEAGLEGVRFTGEGSVWDGLLAAMDARAAFEAARAADPELSAADFLLFSENNVGSLRSMVDQARWLARGLREHISREAWEEINGLYLTLSNHPHAVDAELEQVCGDIRRRVQTVLGLYDNTALRDEGREWFRCGMFIERADMTSRILDAKYHILLPDASEVGGPLDRFQWMAILRSASAWEAYHKIGRREVNAPAVVELLAFNREFPRSLLFSVMALRRHYEQATAETPPARRIAALREIVLLELDVSTLRIDEVVRGGLHEFLDDFQARLIKIDEAVTGNIFRLIPEPVAVQQQQQWQHRWQ